MTFEAQVLAFVRRLQDAYFAKGDTHSVLAVADEQCSLIGTGRDEFCRSRAELEQQFANELEQFSGSFHIQQDEIQLCVLSDELCLVYGTLHAIAQKPDMADLHSRISVVIRRDADGLHLVHMHMSNPDRAQAPGTYYTSRVLAQEREQLQDEVLKTTQSLQVFSENIPGGAHCCLSDEWLTLDSVSDGFCALTGYSRQEIHDQFFNRFFSMVYAEDRETMTQAMASQLQRGNSLELEYRIQCKDGTLLWVMDRGNFISCAEGGGRFYCLLLDITQQKQEREAMRLLLERHQVIMNQATDIIFEWDIVTDTIVYSGNWYKRFGYTPHSQLASQAIPVSGNIHPEDCDAFLRLVHDTAAGSPCAEVELRILDAWDNYTWCRVRATTQFSDSGVPLRAVGVIVDIDAEKKQRQQLIDQAERDSLTDLLNKNATKTKISDLLSQTPQQPGALFIMDLDNFKGVNDTYGHLCGDALLTDVANTLRRVFRTADVLGRIGGDEFLLYLPGLTPSRAEERALLLLDSLSEIHIGGSAHTISACVGGAFFPQDATDFYGLYHLADCALYQAKRSSKGCYRAYDPSVCDICPTSAHHYAGSVIDSDSTVPRQKIPEAAFRMLYGSKNVPVTIQQLLEMVGRSYDISRLCIAEDSPDGSGCRVTFQWPDSTAFCDQSWLDALGAALPDLRARYDQDGLLYCQDVSSLPTKLHDLYITAGIRASFHVSITDGKRPCGVICFDECRSSRIWSQEQLHSLTLVAQVISTFLVHQRYKEHASGN